MSDRKLILDGWTRDQLRKSQAKEWWVYSTAISEGWLMLRCGNTGSFGTVRDPSREEWNRAFYAPERPYRWMDDSRVVIDEEVGA